MKHSGVYVNADKLAECKEVSNDCQTLAQKLLTEIFTTKALGTCSLSNNAKFTKTDRTLRVMYPDNGVIVN